VVVSIRGQVRTLISIFRQHWKITLLAGALNPCLYYLVLIEAYDRLPAKVALPVVAVICPLFSGFKVPLPGLAGAI
jgi:drug/metabolite transporter (DMT)-like permease